MTTAINNTIRFDEIRADLDFISQLPVLSRDDAWDWIGEGDFWCQGVYGKKLQNGTAACLAGWHLLRKGYRLVAVNVQCEVRSVWMLPDIDIEISCPEIVARQDYGLSIEQSGQLFHGSNTIEQMVEIIDTWERGDTYLHPIFDPEGIAHDL